MALVLVVGEAVFSKGERENKSMKNFVIFSFLTVFITVLVFGSIAYYFVNLNKSNSIKVGDTVVSYTKLPTNIAVKQDTKLSDILSYIVCEVKEVPKNELEPLKLKVIDVYSSSDYTINQTIHLPPKDLSFYDQEMKVINELEKYIKSKRFKFAFREIQKYLGYITDLKTKLTSNKFDINQEYKAYRSGKFIANDVLKMTRVKSKLNELNTYLNSIYELDKTYYNDYGGHVLSLTNSKDLLDNYELYLREHKLGLHHLNGTRILYHLESLNPVPERLFVTMKKFFNNGSRFDINTEFFKNEKLNQNVLAFKDKVDLNSLNLGLSIFNENELNLKINELNTSISNIRADRERTKKAQDYFNEFTNFLIRHGNRILKDIGSPNTIDTVHITELDIIKEKHKEYLNRRSKELDVFDKNINTLKNKLSNVLVDLDKLLTHRKSTLGYNLGGQTDMKLSYVYLLQDNKAKCEFTLRNVFMSYLEPDLNYLINSKLYKENLNNNQFLIGSFRMLSNDQSFSFKKMISNNNL